MGFNTDNELQNEHDDDQYEDDEGFEEEHDDEEYEDDESDSDEGEGGPSGSAPDSEDEHDKNDGDVNQDSVQAAIGKQHAKFREEERKRIAAEERLQQLEDERIQAMRPVVPPMPDRYDDDYEEKVKARDEKIREALEFDRQEQERTAQRGYAQQQKNAEKMQELQKNAASYAQRAEKLGMTKEQLAKAGAAVQQIGLDDSVAMQILKDDFGPLITKHLAENPGTAVDLAYMSPVEAAIYIERNIRPKVAVRKRKKSKTPPPRDKGRGQRRSSGKERQKRPNAPSYRLK
jgi:hypothetical protein